MKHKGFMGAVATPAVRAHEIGYPEPPCCALSAEPAATDGRRADGEELPGSWDGVCYWVLGRWVSVWDQIFEAAFLQRSKDLVATSFAQVGICFGERA